MVVVFSMIVLMKAHDILFTSYLAFRQQTFSRIFLSFWAAAKDFKISDNSMKTV